VLRASGIPHVTLRPNAYMQNMLLQRAGKPVRLLFYRDETGAIFNTYSCFARGLDMMNAAYHYLDLTPLVERFTVVIASPRGFAGSSRLGADIPYRVGDMAEDLKAVMQVVGFERFSVFGYSFTGVFAPWIAHLTGTVDAVVSGGFPIVGDELYLGKKLWLSRIKKNYRLKPGREERPLIARSALHLEELELPHPVTGEPLTIKSELPKERAQMECPMRERIFLN